MSKNQTFLRNTWYQVPCTTTIVVRSEFSILTASNQIETVTQEDPYDNGGYDPFNF